MRNDNRPHDQLRPVQLTANVNAYAEGSVLIECGQTKVMCTATVDALLPKWLVGTQQGWITAEYGMLPRSTHTRMHREKTSASGRTQEISRLIARSLRAAVDLKALGERQIIVDCDVLQADGGTRTASITGGFVALALALRSLHARGSLSSLPLRHYVSAVSCGLHDNKAFLDLNYEEDSTCETDMNFVMTDTREFVEIQGTAEGRPFSTEQLQTLLELAKDGCQNLFLKQSQIVGEFFPLKQKI